MSAKMLLVDDKPKAIHIVSQALHAMGNEVVVAV
jgi:hypothetical protein